MQVLEGEESAVLETYRRIERDARHHGLLTLLKERDVERMFPDWAMAFCNLKSPDVISNPGFSPFLNTPLTGDEFASDPARCAKFLLTFKEIIH